MIGTGLSLANIDNLQKILQPICPILDLGMLKHIIEVLYAFHSIHLNAPLLLFMVCETWIIWIPAMVLSGHFLPTVVFLPYAPSRHFAQLAFIKVSLGASSYFLKSWRASYWLSTHRPGPSVCFLHSNPQSSIHLSFVFIHIKIAKVLLMAQTLIRSAATLISNHKNLKQQSN